MAPALPPEPRFDLVVSGAPARDVFLSLVTETRFSMLVHPAVSGALSVTLKGRDGARDAGGHPRRLWL